eukprot:4527381-Prymnesium_polylepis.1
MLCVMCSDNITGYGNNAHPFQKVNAVTLATSVSCFKDVYDTPQCRASRTFTTRHVESRNRV